MRSSIPAGTGDEDTSLLLLPELIVIVVLTMVGEMVAEGVVMAVTMDLVDDLIGIMLPLLTLLPLPLLFFVPLIVGEAREEAEGEGEEVVIEHVVKHSVILSE